jgi:energy-coupling factor transport system permease protein
MNGLKIGQYVRGNSFLHKLDPRTKLLGCFVMIITSLLKNNTSALYINVVLLLLCILLCGIKFKQFVKMVRPIRYMLLLTFIFQSIFISGEKLIDLWVISVSREGLHIGIVTIARIFVLYFCSILLTRTTTPAQLTAAIEALLFPMVRIGIPINKFATLINVSLRFIPVIIEEAETITCAQKARGAPFNSKSLIKKFKAIFSVLIPVLASSLQRAADIAIAMESRCYTGEINHNRIKGLSFGKSDIIALGLISTSIVIVLV